MALVVAAFDRRVLRVVGALALSQALVLIALTPWAFRNLRQFDQFTLVRGSFWQLAFASWGELPNPWGLGFDDKEYWHWIDENCPSCSPGAQQQAMGKFLLSDVVATAPFPRHVTNLLALRIPRALAVGRTPEGVFRADAPPRQAAALRFAFQEWDRVLPVIALFAGVGLVVALARRDRRAAVALSLAPTLFLTGFSLVFYVELRKTVPGYGFVFVLAGIGTASICGSLWRTARRLGPPPKVASIAGFAAVGFWTTVYSQSPSIAAGGETHSEIVTGTGEVWGWGGDLYGQLGNDQQLERYAVDPKTKARGLEHVRSVAAGGNHTLAITDDGALWGWGDNSLGQLGDGTRRTRRRPIRLPVAGPIRAVAGGVAHSLALDNDGSIWAWGSNLYGQLGTHSAVESLQPVRVPLDRPAVSIAAGWFFSMAVDDAGRVWAWGRNRRGQLGDGSILDRHAPGLVLNISGIRSIAAGHQHALALGSDGRVWSWGANDYGQVGVPRSDHVVLARTYLMLDTIAQEAARDQASQNTDQSIEGRTELIPRQVPGIPATASVAAAADCSFLVTRGDRVWAWGDNLHGQLGDGTFDTHATPVPVVGLPPVVTVAAGHSHVMALAKDWTLWTWGFGHYGQLGDGLIERRRSVPRMVMNLRAREPVLDLSAGNAMVLSAQDVGWTEPGVVIDGRRVIIRNTAAGRYTYAALAKPVRVGKETDRRFLFAQGTVRSGAITVGIQEHGNWVFQTNVDVPGPFTVLWEVPASMDAVAVIAHRLPAENLESDVEIHAWGWIKTLPSAPR
jgi:alpha-tubulin suppressor-like RCC1 family protein